MKVFRVVMFVLLWAYCAAVWTHIGVQYFAHRSRVFEAKKLAAEMANDGDRYRVVTYEDCGNGLHSEILDIVLFSQRPKGGFALRSLVIPEQWLSASDWTHIQEGDVICLDYQDPRTSTVPDDNHLRYLRARRLRS